MSDATGEDVFVQLTCVWRVILAGVVALESKIRYRRLVAKMSRCNDTERFTDAGHRSILLPGLSATTIVNAKACSAG